ncbi:MAG: Gfo/Idh/MocA family oxidoreductase [Verrucomicrobiota bacterium]
MLGADGQTPPSGKITIGVLGVGAQGQPDMRNFLGKADARVTAICDVNRRNIERARAHVAAAYGSPDVKVFSDFRELNADRSIDAVLMALPVHWHSVPALDAILHGKHIYHEKPMGMSFEEARRVRAAVRKQGVVFQFGTQQRSDWRFRLACELALNGRRSRCLVAGTVLPFPNSRCPITWIGTAGWVRRRSHPSMRRNSSATTTRT